MNLVSTFLFSYCRRTDVFIEDFCYVAGTLDLKNGLEYQRKWLSNVFDQDVNTPNPTCAELGGVDTPRDTVGSDCAVRSEPPEEPASSESPTSAGVEEMEPTDAPTVTPEGDGATAMSFSAVAIVATAMSFFL